MLRREETSVSRARQLRGDPDEKRIIAENVILADLAIARLHTVAPRELERAVGTVPVAIQRMNAKFPDVAYSGTLSEKSGQSFIMVAMTST